MRYSDLPGLGSKLSCLGLGCWQLGGHGWGKVLEKEMVKAVHKAIDCGLNLFDTAPIYGLGHSEELLAKALGARRKDIIIATKVGLTWGKGKTFEKLTNSSPASINREIEASLRRLRTDYIDIYQLHWPDPNTPIEATMTTLEKLKKSGKIRVIGCCNFSLPQLKEALKYGEIKTVQIPYNLIDREFEYDLLPFCRENGIAVLAYSPLAKGLLSGKYDSHTKFGSDDHRSRHKYFQDKELPKNLEALEKVKLVAQRLGMTPAQIALRWVLENECVTTAIFGAKNTAQVEENIVAWDLAPSQEDIEFLNAEI